MPPDQIPTLTAWADEPTILDREGRPALVCWWTLEPKRRAGVVWPDGAWEVFTPSADPCDGWSVGSGTADDQGEGYDEARAALWLLCDRLRDLAARNTNSKSGGPL